MKLPPQSTETQDKTSDDIMTRMQVLLSEKDDIIEKKSDVISEQQKRIQLLEEYLRLEKSKRFGRSSEQTPPEQGNLFNEVEVTAEPEQPAVENNATSAKKGRKPFAKNLPRHQVFAYLTDEEKTGAIDTFFVKVREELDIIPAKVQIFRIYARKSGLC
jgi:hypothetical protein